MSDARSADTVAPLPGAGPRRPVIPTPDSPNAAPGGLSGSSTGVIDVTDSALAGGTGADAAWADGSWTDAAGVSPFGMPEPDVAPVAEYELYAPPATTASMPVAASGSGWDDDWAQAGPAPAYGAGPAPAYGSGPAPAYGAGPAPAYGAGPAPAYGAGPAPAYGSGPAPAYGSGPAPAYGASDNDWGSGGTATAVMAPAATAVAVESIGDEWGEWQTAAPSTAPAGGTNGTAKAKAKAGGLAFGAAADGAAAGMRERIAGLKDNLTDDDGKPRREAIIGGVVFLAIVPLIITLAIWSTRSAQARRDAKSANSFQVPGNESSANDGARTNTSSSSDYPQDLGSGYTAGLGNPTPGDQSPSASAIPYATSSSGDSSGGIYYPPGYSRPSSGSGGGSSTYRPPSGGTGGGSSSPTPTPATTPPTPTTVPPAPAGPPAIAALTNAPLTGTSGVYQGASLTVTPTANGCATVNIGGDQENVCLNGTAAAVRPIYKRMTGWFNADGSQAFAGCDAGAVSCTSNGGLVVGPTSTVSRLSNGQTSISTNFGVRPSGLFQAGSWKETIVMDAAGKIVSVVRNVTIQIPGYTYVENVSLNRA